jgi:hypothetical protein
MVTQFKKYRNQQNKTTGRQTAASTARKHTREMGNRFQIHPQRFKATDQNTLLHIFSPLNRKPLIFITIDQLS